MIETLSWPVPPAEPNVVRWYQKINPIFWFQNDEGIDPAYMPGSAPWVRSIEWWLRNPFWNFFKYVVGVEDRHIIVTGPQPVFATVWSDVGSTGYKWSIIKVGILRLPFVSYSGTHWLWYLGWLPSGGRLGVKINYR